MAEVVESGAGYQEDGNILTRHVGPFPGWVWIAVVVGGFVIYKLFIGGSSSSSSNTGTALGFGGYMPSGGSTDSTGGSTSTTDSGLAAAIQQIQANATAIAGTQQLDLLQNQLEMTLNTKIGLEQQLTNAGINLGTYRTNLANLQKAYSACRTTACRRTYGARITAEKSKINSTVSQINTINRSTMPSLNAQIGTIQSLITNQEQTIQITPPNTTSTNTPATLTTSKTTLVSQPTMTVQ